MMNIKRGIDEKTGFAWIEFRPQTNDEETWLHSMRPAPGQAIEFYEIKGEPLWRGLRVVNDSPAPKSARPPAESEKPKPESEGNKENFAQMNEADLLTTIAEKGVPMPKVKRRGDLIKALQDHEAKK